MTNTVQADACAKQVPTNSIFSHRSEQYKAVPCNHPDDPCNECCAYAKAPDMYLCGEFPECRGWEREDGVSVVFLRVGGDV